MSYEKKTWETGEVITADGLNHIEQGIEDASQGGGGDAELMIVNVATTFVPGQGLSWSTDKTFAEIGSAMEAGKVVMARDQTGNLYIPNVGTPMVFTRVVARTDNVAVIGLEIYGLVVDSNDDVNLYTATINTYTE